MPVSSRPSSQHDHQRPSLRERVRTIIFGTESTGGKTFDVTLLVIIILSVITVILDSVSELHARYGTWLITLEWIFTGVFTVEYALRIWAVEKKSRYIFSFFGIVDLLAILPTYLSVFFLHATSLTVIRAIRLLRIFRILKLAHYIGEADVLRSALVASRSKIIVFIGTVITMVVFLGATMYLIESNAGSGFDNIPLSMYWAIVTLTTVGYGDIAPATVLGKFVASLIMLAGYGIIAVPTGIISVEISNARRAKKQESHVVCPGCGKQDHEDAAQYCNHCGSDLRTTSQYEQETQDSLAQNDDYA